LQEVSEVDQTWHETPVWRDIAMAHSSDAVPSLAVNSSQRACLNML
jgi:hypothetical protein